MTNFKIGQSVSYKAAGKCSRLEKLSGKIVTGTIEDINGDELTVYPNHRKSKTAIFHNMRTVVDRKSIVVKNKKGRESAL